MAKPRVIAQPRRRLAVFLTLFALATVGWMVTCPVSAGEEPTFSIKWVEGPTRTPIGTIAEVQLPEGYRFTGQQGTQLLLQAMQNPISGSELGLIAPSGEDGDWFVVFEFDDSGYVKDDDKDSLDADAILESIRQGTEQGNAERRKRGWPTMSIDGWAQTPHYDSKTNNLEWAVRATSEGQPVVNYNTRLLGRSGVMSASLVVDPDRLKAVLPEFRAVLEGYSFQKGHRYSEFREGDKIAKYGLAALVTGGAAAVALKTGLLQKFGKFIIVAIAGAAAFLRKLFRGRSD